MKILFKNAKVLTMNDGPILFDKDVLIEGNKISKIEKNIIPDENTKIIDCTNTVLMPGFKNAHAHGPMTFSRTSSDNLSLNDWLTKCIFPMEDNLKPGDVYNLIKGSFLEYLTSGITTSFEMYYYPKEIAQASKDFNFRTVILSTVTSDRQTIEEIEDCYSTIGDDENNLSTFFFGLHAEYTLSDLKLEGMLSLVNKYKKPIAMHISESENEVEACKNRRNGLTPFEYFDSVGLFKYGATTFHNVYLSENDINIIKKYKINCVSCPGSNSKLASGIAPITRLFNEGVNISLGTDGPGSNNCLDMFKEMLLLFSLEKLKDKNPVGVSAYEILKMATVNGAHAMGLYDCDTIQVGKKADIILINLDKPNMQPLNDIISNIVYSGSKDNIKLTMVDGKIMYQDGKFYLNEDYHDIYKKQQEISNRLNKDNIYLNK